MLDAGSAEGGLRNCGWPIGSTPGNTASTCGEEAVWCKYAVHDGGELGASEDSMEMTEVLGESSGIPLHSGEVGGEKVALWFSHGVP